MAFLKVNRPCPVAPPPGFAILGRARMRWQVFRYGVFGPLSRAGRCFRFEGINHSLFNFQIHCPGNRSKVNFAVAMVSIIFHAGYMLPRLPRLFLSSCSNIVTFSFIPAFSRACLILFMSTLIVLLFLASGSLFHRLSAGPSIVCMVLNLTTLATIKRAQQQSLKLLFCSSHFSFVLILCFNYYIQITKKYLTLIF